MDRVALTEDLSFSRIVYGMWRIADDADRSTSHIRAKIDACLAQGITSVDQADIYGSYTAESLLGNALRDAPGLRDQIEITTKCGIVAPIGKFSGVACKHYDTSAVHIRRAVENSLRDLATDHIDLLLIHRPDPLLDPEETGAVLDALIAEGKLRAVGVSNFRPWDVELLSASMHAPLVTNQIELSLGAVSPFTDGDLAFHQRRKEAIMAWSPLGGGRLMTDEGPVSEQLDQIASDNGVDRAAVAIAFLLHHPATILPVLGTNSLERIARLSDALKVKLTRIQWFQLYQTALGREVP